MEWRDIETAPKDDSPILLLAPNGAIGVGYFRMDEFEGFDLMRTGAAWVGSDPWNYGKSTVTLGGTPAEEATHWMPLPSPPA